MAVSRFSDNNTIINRVAVEVGLNPVNNVFASEDPAFVQLRYLLTTCVQELMEMYEWESLSRTYQITTTSTPGTVGKFALPSDFGYFTDQTGWDRAQNVPLLGPLSPQTYNYLLGRDLTGSTIYASFRLNENEFWVFPTNPAPVNLDINFEYTSRNLIEKAAVVPVEYTDTAEDPADIPQFPPNVITRMLRMKYLEAKGFDSQKATDSFWQTFFSWTGKDNSAPVLNTANGTRGYPYLNSLDNLPDTGYGGAYP